MSDDIKSKKICDICGDATSKQFRIWQKDGEHKGKMMCSKHYSQMIRNGKVSDAMPPISSINKKICCVCGSNNKVHYSKLFNGLYCQRHYSQLYNLGELKERTVFERNDYIIENDIVYIILRNNKYEEVGRAIIDIDDLERVLQCKWRLSTWGYAETKINGDSILMQRFILNEFNLNKIPDHINKNTLDNRKCNLRISNKAQNAWNSSNNSNNTSGIKGVNWFKPAQSWRAYLTKNGVRYDLGYSKNKDEAIRLRLIAEKEHFGEFAPQKHLFKQYGIEG